MKDIVLHTANVSFFYDHHQVLKDVHFSIEKGEYVALTGENGSGKSTLLQLILGELKPSTGAVQVFGEPIQKFHQWPRIGYLPQNAGSALLGFPANCLEIVLANLYSQIGRLPFATRRHKEKAIASLDSVGMADYAKRMPSQLSGGQLQRVLLAKALVSDPEFLILDEPTTAMDEESTYDLYQQLSQLHQKGMTLLTVTHDSHGIAPYVDRILRIRHKTVSPTEKELRP